MKTIIVDIAPYALSRDELDIRMVELASLVSTYGGVTIVKEVQKRDTPDYRTYIGSGKLDEIIAEGELLGAELLIIGNIMKPSQIYQVNEILREKKSKIQAWDRVDLILKIFAQHANSPESKLQIELASIKHMGPRIYGMGMDLSRQWGGSKNAKWQGETNTEIMKRHLREQTEKIQEKLTVYERTRSEHRKNRKRRGFLTIGIVGYTNAGKSTLFNLLTKKHVIAEDKLFATLWTHVGRLYLANTVEDETEYHSGIQLLLSDTIGFIRDLPPNLIAAFHSTLEDSIESDILLHVIDANDPNMLEKIEIVEETLRKIEAKAPRIRVYNKVDIRGPQKIMDTDSPEILGNARISAVTGEGIEDLKKVIRAVLEK